MHPFFPTLVICLVLVVVIGRQRKRGRVPLPPGPLQLPLIGNLLHIPKVRPWEKYREWSLHYESEIIYLHRPGNPLVVVNSAKAARELFEKRSSIYSDRPRLTMLNDLMGFSWHVAFAPHGESWRRLRRLFHKFHSSVVVKHRPVELAAVHDLLQHLLNDPSNFMRNIRIMAGKIIIQVAYGLDVESTNDPFIQIAEVAMDAMARAGVYGSYLVDIFPILKHLPEWMPGMTFKRQAREWRKSVMGMVELPFAQVKAAMAEGNVVPSVLTRLLDSDNTDSNEILIRDTVGAMYSAGSDTSVAALGTFLLAMLQNPNVQRNAQKAVDEVVGHDRLPDFSDWGLIPYVDAIVREVLRWKPITPLAVEHCLKEDDEYNGYYLPAGSVVAGNVWAILHDDSVYPEPYLFNPDRWMKGPVLNTDMDFPSAAFGFGRRLCPGQHFAVSSIWISIVSILATFDVLKPVDKDGKVVEQEVEYTSGLICHPMPFRCEIRPRSDTAAALVRSVTMLEA